MPPYTIRRGDRQFGPYGLDQVQSYYAEGRLYPDDLVWDDEENAWQRLSGILKASPVPPPPAQRPEDVRHLLSANVGRSHEENFHAVGDARDGAPPRDDGEINVPGAAFYAASGQPVLAAAVALNLINPNRVRWSWRAFLAYGAFTVAFIFLHNPLFVLLHALFGIWYVYALGFGSIGLFLVYVGLLHGQMAGIPIRPRAPIIPAFFWCWMVGYFLYIVATGGLPDL
jgi:hypothetical protein